MARARKAFRNDIADYVKRLLNGYFYGSHGYSRKIGSKEEYMELAKVFSRDFRYDNLRSTVCSEEGCETRATFSD